MFQIQKLDLLIAIYIFCIAVTELMGGKTFILPSIGSLQLNASVAILILPLVYTINDMITEVFGVERARSLVRAGILVVFLILLFSILATALPPSKRFQGMERSYDQIFQVSARISAASLTAFALAEFLDVLVFAKMRQALGKKGLWLRNNISNFVSEFVDTAVFMFLAFYNLARPLNDNLGFLISLIIPYYLLKCLMSVLETPLVYLGVNWLKDEKSK